MRLCYERGVQRRTLRRLEFSGSGAKRRSHNQESSRHRGYDSSRLETVMALSWGLLLVMDARNTARR